jgi:molecular chaperone GrpE
MNTNSPPPQDDTTQLQADLAAMTETAKRAMADLQNFKRRTDEERGEIQVFANRKFLEALFPALDNFARAFGSMPEELKSNDWVKGVEAIEANLLKALTDLGLEVIDQIDVPADPHRHEMLMEGEGTPGHVVQIFEKGYAFNGKTIRPAKIMVGKKA